MTDNERIAEWREAWPDEFGPWWFYGWKFKKSVLNPDEKPRLSLVRVSLTGNGKYAVIGEGHFWYPEEGAIGLFIKAVLPDLPTTALVKMIKEEADDST